MVTWKSDSKGMSATVGACSLEVRIVAWANGDTRYAWRVTGPREIADGCLFVSIDAAKKGAEGEAAQMNEAAGK